MCADTSEKLQQGAFGWRSLALLGISFSAAGYFAPWSFGLDLAGWAGMLVAFVIVAFFYSCLLRCLAEMSAAIPSSGGGQAFASAALGPVAGFTAGATALVQWICSAAALAVLMGTYLESMTGLPATMIALAAYIVFVCILLTGAGEAVILTLISSLLALAGAVAFVWYCGQAVGPGSFTALEFGELRPEGLWLAMPFGVTFFLGLEGVPLAAEEAVEPGRNVPKALGIALSSVALLGLAVLILGPAGAGPAALQGSGEPIIAGLTAVAASPLVLAAVSIAAIAGLATSLFGSMFAYSRLVFAMARQHELPHSLSRLNRRHAPVLGLIVPTVISAVLALSGRLDELIIMMVFCACISYLLTFVSFIALRMRRPDLERPYRLNLGMLTAATGIMLGIAIFLSCISGNARWSGIGAAMLIAMLLYRLARSRWKGPMPSMP